MAHRFEPKSLESFNPIELDKKEQIRLEFDDIEIEEKIRPIRKETLGNVNFITELITSQFLSKNVAVTCMNAVFSKLEFYQSSENKIAYEITNHLIWLNIEAIVILLDKFGTLINKIDKKMKVDQAQEFNGKIDEFIAKIEDFIEKNRSRLPGHVIYKVINLVEKKRNNWELSEVDKMQKAKGLDELNNEMDRQMNIQYDQGVFTKKNKRRPSFVD